MRSTRGGEHGGWRFMPMLPRSLPLGPCLSPGGPAARRSAAAALLLFAAAAGYAATLGSGASAPTSPSAPAAVVGQRAVAAYGRLPLRFEENRGQTGPRVEFLSRGEGYTLFLTPREAVLSLTRTRDGRGSSFAARSGDRQRTDRAVVRLSLLGGGAQPSVEPGRRLPGASNYLQGSNPKRWHRGVPSYASVRYREAYPGIDVVYHGKRRRLEYDFVVAPAADPGRIKLRLKGAKRLALARSGDLVLHTGAGALRQRRPVAYQRIRGARRPVRSRYVLEGKRRIGLRVGAYDRSRPLVIDPVLTYSTFVGGGGASTVGKGIAADAAGAAYITGKTEAPDFPTTSGVLQGASPGNADAFVTKLNPAGTALVYSTFLGGGAVNDPDAGEFPADEGKGIKVDSAGRAYVAGETGSIDFPTTPNAFEASFSSSDELVNAFVSVLNPAGSGLVYSTYLGSPISRAEDIAIDPSGDGLRKAYVTGSVSTAGFPTRTPTPAATPLQSVRRGSRDVFVAKLDPAAASGDASLVYGSYLGGSRQDDGYDIAVDTAGNAYVTGSTRSGGADAFPFPTTGNAVQPARAGSALCLGAAVPCGDAFMAKVNPDATALAYSTYLGGTGEENFPLAEARPGGIAVDGAGNAYVTGMTRSDDFPTRNPFQAARRPGVCTVGAGTEPCADAFVTKLDTAASGSNSLVFSSYLGGTGDDQGNGVAVDPQGRAYLTGFTDAEDFPTAVPLAPRGLTRPPTALSGTHGDAWVTRVRTDGALSFSTYLGGGGGEDGYRVATDPGGNAYVTGSTFSVDFPATAGAFRTTNPGSGQSGAQAAFVAKIAPADARTVLVGSLAPRSGGSEGGTTVVIRGSGFAGATSVSFGGVRAESFRVDSNNQITAVSPAHAVGSAPVVVSGPSGSSPANPSATYVYGEGSFSPTGSLAFGRAWTEAVMLPNGKVLVAGGSTGGAAVATAELYDPATGTWTPTGALNLARCDHSLTLLPNGRVLAAGGNTECRSTEDFNRTNTAELYDPATGRWTPANPMAAQHAFHTATVLSGPACSGASRPSYCGRVLIAGGRSIAQATSAELYDPASGNWTTAGPMIVPRYLHTATVLGGPACTGASPPGYCGKVLAVAGATAAGSSTTTAELYDPATNSWAAASPPGQARTNHTATLLGNGRVLVAGGSSFTPSAELYNPAANAWSLTAGLMRSPRRGHAAAAMPGGKVLLVGGFRFSSVLDSAEVYDEATARFTSAGLMNRYRFKPFAMLLSRNCASNCGKVLIGGDVEGSHRSTELYTRSRARPGRGGGGAPPTYGGPSAPFAGCPALTANVIRGTAASNAITGTPRADRIFAGAGNDTVDALAGDDCVDLGPGTDRGQGGFGADLMLGGLGRDRMAGSNGNDRLRGGASGDRLIGGFGNDSLHGQSGSDRLGGERGRDRINGGSGGDVISAGSSGDRVAGDQGSDRINGNSGNDSIRGNSGGDRLKGSTGRDRLSGGSGNDRIDARDGQRDRVDCGRGRDRVLADRVDRVARNCERVRRARTRSSAAVASVGRAVARVHNGGRAVRVGASRE